MKEKRRIMFFGDSNTYGYDPRGLLGGRYPASVRWVDRLAEQFADEWEIIPRGMNGRCIPEIPEDAIYTELMLKKAGALDVLAIMLGTNDVILTSCPEASFAARRMERFLTFLTAETPALHDARILLIAPPPMDSAASDQPEYGRYVLETQKLCALYKDLAASFGTLFENTGDWNLPMAFDYAHLSEEGHLVFAERMAAVLCGL